MKKLYLAILSLSALAASGATFAEPVTVKGGSGQINFMGFINNDACSVDGSTGKDKVISVDMGNVSIKDMGSDTAPNAGRISANDFNLRSTVMLAPKYQWCSNQASTGALAWLQVKKC